MKPHRRRRRMSIRRWMAILLLGVAALIGIYIAALHWEEDSQTQERGVAQSAIGQYKRVVHEGKTYTEKPWLTSILLMGVDKPSDADAYGARQGGQADFMMLLVIDSSEKRISRLQIDRDTIAEVETLGILGNAIGTSPMQICLSHAFGTTPQENCEHAVKAVENLLEGEGIDLYMALDMDGIGVLNHALGGVTVTITDDFSQSDPAMVPGATLCLSDEQAEIFVRGRMTVGDGTNASRMKRQNEYVRAATEKFRERMDEDPAFVNGFLDAIESVTTTNISRGRLLNEINNAYRYDTPEIETLPGEHSIGEDGFMEFRVQEDAVLDWILHTLYTQQN